MSITVEIPNDLAEELSVEAAQQGVPLEEYARRVLESGRRSTATPRDGAELVAYWQSEGLIGSRPDILDSSKYARDLRSKAERRTQG